MQARLIGTLLLTLGLATAGHATTFSRGSSTIKIVGTGQEAIYAYDTATELYLFDLSSGGTSEPGPGCYRDADDPTGPEVLCPLDGITKITVQLDSATAGEHDMVWRIGNASYAKVTTLQIAGGKGRSAVGPLPLGCYYNAAAVCVPAPLSHVTSLSFTAPKGSNFILVNQ